MFATEPTMSVQILSDRVRAHSSTLGIPAPAIHASPEADDPGLLTMLRHAYSGRFVAFTVRVRGRHHLHVDPVTVDRLTDPALDALAAHECGHAADWLAGLSETLGSLLLPESWHRALEGRAGPRREAFADRVASALAGPEALRLLHAEAGAALGMTAPPGLVPTYRNGLPPSLRLRAVAP